MQMYYSFLFAMLLLLASNIAQAQNITISGKVLAEEDGVAAGLPGVTVRIKDTASGTVTDADGSFKIEAAADAILIMSFVGYQTEMVSVTGRTYIETLLAQDITALEEVLVVGYGEVSERDLTGSVASVKPEEITAFPAQSAVQTLQGRAAGVQIQSNNGGQPGGGFSVKIRGGTSINASSDPIIVVDGFVGAEMPPPEDIASIEILKDASATAIYGSRGANGVIMVSTKRGETGQMKVNFSSAYTFQQVINRLDLLNANQFTNYIQEINPNYRNMGSDTDWQDEIFQGGAITNNQLSLSGGSDNIRYYVSGTYFGQEGIVRGSGFDRYSITSNIDIDATDKIKFGLGLFGRRTENEGINTQEVSGGRGAAGVTSSALRFNPDQGIFNPDGSFTLSAVGDDIDNPVALTEALDREVVANRFQGNTFGEIALTDWLSFKSTLGVTIDDQREGLYASKRLIRGQGVGGFASLESRKRTSLLAENYFTASKELGQTHLNLVAGYSYQHFVNDEFLASSSGFISDNNRFWNLSQGAIPNSPSSQRTESVIKSYYTRANWSVLDKYVFTFTARYDGASNFSADNKWAFFPSGAVAWHMGDEEFMREFGAISEWRWRVSYGLVGNQAIDPYQSLAQLMAVYGTRGGRPINAVRVENLANDDLTWETTAQLDIGVDIGLFQGRVGLAVDAYRMVTNDLLFERDLPGYVGIATQLQNVGAVENRGLEFTLNTENLTGAVTWSTNFNISFNRNEVIELPDNGADIFYRTAPGHLRIGNEQHVLREGQPVGVFYGFIYDGVYQQGEEFLTGSGFEQEAGGERFVDINGDGQLGFNEDATIIGDPNPDFTWSVNNTLTYKNFDLNIFVQGSQGGDMLSYTLLELGTLSGFNNATTDALNRWQPNNTDTDVPKASGSRSNMASTRWVYDASYIRLKNIALGYNLPKSLASKLRMRSVRAYVSAQNLFTITDFPGFDPEVGFRNDPNSASGNRNLGLDYGSYPNARSYVVGINLGI